MAGYFTKNKDKNIENVFTKMENGNSTIWPQVHYEPSMMSQRKTP
jgi:hypothetical protein